MNIAMFITGILVGIGIALFSFGANAIGTLRVDRSDPNEPPYLFVELSEDVGSLMKKKYVLFKINIKNYIPHK